MQPQDGFAPLPLWHRLAHPDGWHRVTAPGGYELWHFEVHSDDGRTHLVADLSQGSFLNARYLRAYRRFVRRPHRVVPPLPGDFPGASVALFRDGRPVAGFARRFPAGQLDASTDRPALAIGPNRLYPDGEGLVLEVVDAPLEEPVAPATPAADRVGGEPKLTARLRFVPEWTSEPTLRRALEHRISGGDHFWLPAAARCRVEGQVKLAGRPSETLTGLGYRDHRFGTGPPGLGISRWMHGRAFTERGVSIIQIARLAGPRPADEFLLLEAEGSSLRQLTLAQPPRVGWSRGGRWMLTFPRSVDAGAAMRLSNPRLLDSRPARLRLLYDAEVHGRRTTALCEISHPSRLHWPILSRLAELGTDVATP